MRLTNSTFSFDNDLGSYRGRVDICVNETFLPICDLGWDKRDAQVACRYIYGSSYGETSAITMTYSNVEIHAFPVFSPTYYA